MKKSQKMVMAILTVMGMGVVSLPLHASSSGCARCDQIREDNALHHKNYDYYEDFEKEQPGKPAAVPVKPATPVKESAPSKPDSVKTGQV